MSFQQLIARWLAAQATATVKRELYSAVQNAATEQSPEAGTELVRCEDHDVKYSEPPPTDIGFVFAMPMEAAGIVDRLKDAETTIGDQRRFHTGRFGKFRVAVVESGVGQAKAAQATDALIEAFQPQRIVSAGYSGALAENLKRFAIRIPQTVVRESDGRRLHLAGAPSPEGETLLTTDFVAATPKVKKSLGKKFAAQLVDMETFAVAERSLNRGIPFLSVRIVLDTVAEAIPNDVQRIMKNAERGTARLVGSVLGSLFSRPSALIDLYTLKERALDATDRLAKRVYREIAENGADK